MSANLRHVLDFIQSLLAETPATNDMLRPDLLISDHCHPKVPATHYPGASF
jgi:hypothetical protein